MEIDFSPGQIPPARTAGSRNSAAAASTPVSPEPLQGMAQLQQKLNEVALTRPEKMAAMREVISDVKYPPEDLLNSIAHLLAIHLNE
jgi:hypothetical protein